LSDEGWRFRPCGEQVWLPLDSYEDHQQALEDQLTRGEGVVYVEAIFRHQAEGYRLSMLSFADGSGPPCATEDEDYELWLENPDEGWRLVINDGDTRASGFPGLNAKKYNGPFWACDISFSVVYAEERPQLAWTLKDEPCFDARGNWHRFHADVAVGSMNYQGCGRQGRGIDDIGSGCSF
jgi:hypothetical protein